MCELLLLKYRLQLRAQLFLHSHITLLQARVKASHQHRGLRPYKLLVRCCHCIFRAALPGLSLTEDIVSVLESFLDCVEHENHVSGREIANRHHF